MMSMDGSINDNHTRCVTDTPREAREPSSLAIVHRERRDCSEVIGAREHVKEPGSCAGQQREH
jgi:hypothetical protein